MPKVDYKISKVKDTKDGKYTVNVRYYIGEDALVMKFNPETDTFEQITQYTRTQIYEEVEYEIENISVDTKEVDRDSLSSFLRVELENKIKILGRSLFSSINEQEVKRSDKNDLKNIKVNKETKK